MNETVGPVMGSAISEACIENPVANISGNTSKASAMRSDKDSVAAAYCTVGESGFLGKPSNGVVVGLLVLPLDIKLCDIRHGSQRHEGKPAHTR